MEPELLVSHLGKEMVQGLSILPHCLQDCKTSAFGTEPSSDLLIPVTLGQPMAPNSLETELIITLYLMVVVFLVLFLCVAMMPFLCYSQLSFLLSDVHTTLLLASQVLLKWVRVFLKSVQLSTLFLLFPLTLFCMLHFCA